MTVLTDLIATREALSAELLAESVSADPDEAPGVAWSQHRTDLINQIKELDVLILRQQGAVEIQSIALG